MTNHWIDLMNADVVMICGSNAVENHPLAARWIQRTKERGAIDPLPRSALHAHRRLRGRLLHAAARGPTSPWSEG